MAEEHEGLLALPPVTATRRPRLAMGVGVMWDDESIDGQAKRLLGPRRPRPVKRLVVYGKCNYARCHGLDSRTGGRSAALCHPSQQRRAVRQSVNRTPAVGTLATPTRNTGWSGAVRCDAMRCDPCEGFWPGACSFAPGISPSLPPNCVHRNGSLPGWHIHHPAATRTA